jgi:predicted 3-demethylubiquinone-9 3-methyltransferase (glyoxalase superfamily)
MFSVSTQKIVSNLWFNNNADEAVAFYLSIFPGSKMLSTMCYPTEGLLDFQQEFAGKTLTIDFELFGQRFIAINAGDQFHFTEAISLMVNCHDQAEIDYYWDRLTADGGEPSQCGWLKDKYGLSWQVIPEHFEQHMATPGAFQKMLGMTKIVLADFTS